MALEIRSFDPGQTTGYCEIIVISTGSITHKRRREINTLNMIYRRVHRDGPAAITLNTIEVCFEGWRNFPGGPAYLEVVAREVIGVIKIACIHAGLECYEYMPATKALIQDKHLKALDLWHSSPHVRDATKIALVHLHKLHRELFDAIMKEVLSEKETS